MKILYLPNEYSQQRQREKKSNIYPVRMAMEAEWYRRQGHNVQWSYPCFSPVEKVINEPENIPFLSLPAPNRVFTKAKEYTSGNYKYLPGTHMQVADGCWWGKCTFCVENGRPYEVRDLGSVTEEIIECKRLGFREIFDDSGTFPTGKWLDDFCKLWKDNKAIKFGCNMRMVDVDYKAMKNAGFRMVLFGLESANQNTLDKINKGVKEDDYKYIINASKAGLEPHLAFMISYPWETYKDATRTINLVKHLLIKGYVKTAQCSFYTPPTGQEKGNEKYRYLTNKIYDVAFNPLFWYNKIINIKSIEDFQYLIRQIKEGINAKANYFNKIKV